ncbi:uncharacterized protein DUF1700 [Lachnotalea glycerini]|jgi:uncharacterized membrane protein|uniref:DUF1700 domain-containing protein n=1 Tax=Lachnotalea glycerini TaxID=1763509 RepID=A0A255II92_9FIRM|nr:DUF1700 domain-containing protein [Lachnotalea glycerini]PXV85144.1 uncharacterized protein DUF1700 [Lachnotalea glycerini]RDY31950.1 DUF1700 domain-containing protein [Lachnotalea glycerini]
MSKHEFLNTLQEALEGEVTQNVMNENLSYYKNYIDGEIRKGKSESMVLQQLGEPRLIAKTIIDTNSIEKNSRTYTYSNENAEEQKEESRRKGFNAAYDEQDGWDVRFGNFKINSWYGKMLIIIMLIVILCIVGQIAIAILPILFPVIVIFFLVSYFTGGRR